MAGQQTTQAAPGAETAPTSKPNRKKRYRLNEDGNDYCVYQLHPGSPEIPQGSLLPIADMPRFSSSAEADRWVKANGSKLAGFQVMIFRAFEVMNIVVEEKPAVTVTRKPKVQVTGPEESEES